MPKLEGGSDPKNDKVEHSSQQDDIDNMLDDQLGLTDEERQLDPDREGLDVRAEKTTDLLNEPERREPDIQVKRDRQADDRHEDDSPLTRAMKTIEEQGNRLRELETRISQTDTSRAERREPQIEMVEVLPGINLPKDRSKWPIKITDRDLVALGWNDGTDGTPKGGPAEVLNILGNALYLFAVETIPELAGRAFESRLIEKENTSRSISAFEQMFPHLSRYRDIVSLIERNERQNPTSSLRGKFGNDYYQEVGRLGEAKIADIRGISVEQYRAEVASQRRSSSNNDGRGRPRTVSTGGGTRTSGRSKPQSDFERDSADL